jgi:hypothetical protein
VADGVSDRVLEVGEIAGVEVGSTVVGVGVMVAVGGK